MKATNRIWNSYMRSYDFLTQVRGYMDNLGEILFASGVKTGERVLDAGSGTGNLSMLFKSKGADVTGYDFSATAVAKHREKDPDANVILGSLEDRLLLKSEHFDIVCCASVLFALSQEGCAQAMCEFQRVLRPGGRLVLTVPARENRVSNLARMHFRTLRQTHPNYVRQFVSDLPNLMQVMYYGSQITKLPDWSGFHRFNESEIEALAQSSGFTDLRVSRTFGGHFYLLVGCKPLCAR